MRKYEFFKLMIPCLIFFLLIFFSAPPEITVEKSWVHASEGCDINIVCSVHGDVNSEVFFFYYLLKNVVSIFYYLKIETLLYFLMER